MYFSCIPEIFSIKLKADKIKRRFLDEIREKYADFIIEKPPTGAGIAHIKFEVSRGGSVATGKSGKHGNKHFVFSRRDVDFLFDISKLTGVCRISENIYSFDSFMRLLWSVMLVRTQGMLLHSAALTMGGYAYLFVGPSGAGKSTVVKNSLAGNFGVISDELVPVFIRDKKLLTSRSPFWGELEPVKNTSGACFEVKKIFFLSGHSEALSVRRVFQDDAVGSLLKNLFWVFECPALSENILGLAGWIYEKALCKKIFFRKDFIPTEEFLNL